MRKNMVFMTTCFLMFALCCKSKEHSINRKERILLDKLYCDTVKKDSFFFLAKQLKKEIEQGIEMSTDRMIMSVKTYNTLHILEISDTQNKKKFSIEYIEAFRKIFLDKVVKDLECTLGKGMTIYSKKYDIYVGIGSEFRCKDVYTIM